MCPMCKDGDIERVSKGTMKCNACGYTESPIEFFGIATSPVGTLFIQKGTEVSVVTS